MASKPALALAALLLPGVVQAQSSVQRWANQKIFDRVTITGYRRVGAQFTSVSGDRDAFNLSNYGGLGGQTFTDMGVIDVQGHNVLDVLNFDFTIQDSRYQDPQGQKLSLNIHKGAWKVDAGDIQGSLFNTNRFAQFSKALWGVQAEYRSGSFAVKALHTAAKGEAHTVSIPGTNSAGPYYLQSSQIIHGSESVSVDGTPQTAGQDYVIDYELGAVTFVNRTDLSAKIIPPTSTIVVSYESLSYGGPSGTIDGLGSTYDFGKGGRIGLTALRQTTGGSNANSSRVELFQGFGPASTPYILQFQPQPGTTVVVRLDGVIQTQGVDYSFDPNNPAIFYFNRFVPTTSTVQVVYTPLIVTTVNGDRETYGFDYSLPFSKRGELHLSEATGRLFNTQTPQEGTAKGVDLRYGWNKFDFTGSLRDIPATYINVDTTGLNRNERAGQASLNYKPNSETDLMASMLNSSVTSVSTSSASTPVYTTSRITQAGLTWNITPAKETAWPIALNLNQQTTNGQGDLTRTNTIGLDTHRQFGKLATTFSLSRQDVTGATSANLLTASAKTSMAATETFRTGLDASLSKISSQGASGTGHDVSLYGAYHPSEKFTARLTLNDSDAGPITSLGNYTSGYGVGYDQSTYSATPATTTPNGGTTGRGVVLSAELRPSEKFSTAIALSYRKSTGNITSNSETRSISWSNHLDANADFHLDGNLDFSSTNILDSGLTSTAGTYTFSAEGTPKGRLSYHVGLNGLVSGGDSTYAQSSFGYDIGLTYHLRPRHNLILSYQDGASAGYLGQLDKDFSLTYQYQVWKTLAFNASYRIHDVTNQDPTATSGAYTSHGFFFELAFNFG